VRRFRKATIKDVAQQAGVSTTTVSLFLSGRESVCSPTTAARIRTAVSALSYTPSSLVSGMQKRVTKTLGVCILNPLDRHVTYGSFFFERLWRGILNEADAEGYSVLHYPAVVRDSDHWEAFLDGRVDGILYHAHSLDNARPARVASAGMPIILLTRSLNLPADCGAAYVEEDRTVDLALSHLWNLGHRRIAHVAGPVDAGPKASWRAMVDDIAIRRLDAYDTWMEQRGVADPALVGHAQSWEGKLVPEIVAAWSRLPRPPTAAFCANDALALAVVAAARQRDWRLPEDLSVVGVDNSSAAAEAETPLTSIDVPMEAVGREGTRALLRLMEGAPLGACRVALPVSEIVIRGSTAHCRDGS
jgi:LacI family transcriptional regulator